MKQPLKSIFGKQADQFTTDYTKMGTLLDIVMSKLYHKKPMKYSFSTSEKKELIESHKWECLRPYLIKPEYNQLISTGFLIDPI